MDKCNFCGQKEQAVGLLIAGQQNVHICDNCITQASAILEEAKEKHFTESALSLDDLPKPVEIKQFLDEYIIGQDVAKTHMCVAV